MCPKGDDPITPASGSQVDRRIVVTTTAGSSSALVGTFKLKFAGWETEFPADATGQDATTCAAWFALLGNIASATCTVGTMDATKKTQVYTITITGYVPQGAQNNIHTFDTNPALTLFTCDMTGVTSANTPGCAVTSSVTMTKEFEYCSRRGICNFVTGECACFKGWAGATCAEFAAGKPCSTSASPQGDKAAATTCSGHGVCHAGQCVCHPDFTGKSCGMTKQCPRGAGKQRLECSGRGSCWLGKCICRPGSTGLDCGEMLPCDCSGHGACHASSAGGCVCHPGWTGTNCATEEVCPDDCSGNGVCNDGSCFCFKGYAGDSCAFSVEDGKEAERRKNCVNPDVGDDPAALARVPKIRSKETGGESPAPCSGHGVCGYEMSPAPGSGKAYGRCLCMPGYLGDYCEEEIKCPNDCLGHGTCVAGKCKCRYGYSGEGCQDVIVGVHLCPDDLAG